MATSRIFCTKQAYESMNVHVSTNVHACEPAHAHDGLAGERHSQVAPEVDANLQKQLGFFTPEIWMMPCTCAD